MQQALGETHGGAVVEWLDATWAIQASTTFAPGSVAAGTWATQTMTLNTQTNPLLVGTGMNLRIGPISGGAQATNNLFDAIVITETLIPEPSTLLLLSVGLFVLLFCRRK